MRRAFTLIELLVVIAIIGIGATAATLEYASSQDGARLRGAARDIYATMRLARSKALVMRQPCIVTYSSTDIEGEVSAKVEITSAKIFNGSGKATATNLKGETVWLNPEEEAAAEDRRAAFVVEGKTEEYGEQPTGHTFEDVLFAPIDDEVMKGVCIRVLMGDEELGPTEDRDEEKSRAKISVFSNVDYLIGKLRTSQAQKEAPKPDEPKDGGDGAAKSGSADAGSDRQERVDVVWGVNGSCEPHQVLVYLGGSDPESGLRIKVDRFGAAKIVTEEDER